MLKIVSAPNSVLSEPAKPIAKIDKSILNLIDEMKQTLNATHDPEGVGLAAPQVGKSLQLFITKPTRKSKIQVFINPKIIAQNKTASNAAGAEPFGKLRASKEERGAKIQRSSASGSAKFRDKKKSVKLEGCLSLPNIWGEVERADEIEISYLDEKGIQHTKLFKGFPATIIQHEYDHLQGNLFPKRVLEQKGQLYKSSRNKKGEDEFTEIEL